MGKAKKNATANRKPLGIIELGTGPKEIFATNDFFLNFLFEDSARWEALRLIVNVIVEAYKGMTPATQVRTIDGDIQVETQYKYYTGKTDVSTSQDFRIEASENITYIEVQNRARTIPPIEKRAIEYFGLSLAHNRGNDVTQMWILAEDVDNLLNGNTFANYILGDEETGTRYPLNNNLMFVSLRRLEAKRGGTEAGEMAAFLLGKNIKPRYESVKRVIEIFEKGFESFCEDKEAVRDMSAMVKNRLEGRLEGIEEGKLETAQEMLNDGFTHEQISKYVKISVEDLQEALLARDDSTD